VAEALSSVSPTPSRSAVIEVDHGVYRVTHALPWALDHVHCYAVEGGDGLTLIDTGLSGKATLDGWVYALRELGDRPVAQILLTHFHPDHIGAAAVLAELTAPGEIVQGANDLHSAEQAFGDRRDPVGYEAFLLEHGMAPKLASACVDEEMRVAFPVARPTRIVREGDTLSIGDESFEVLELPGHADGHIGFLGKESRRLFAGDVLLNEITPNVGRWPGSRPDPLREYGDTLARVGDLEPSIVFPGHRGLIRDAAARSKEIQDHHAARLRLHSAALRGGVRTTWEVTRQIWPGRLTLHEMQFALAEAAAHLARLAAEGDAEEVTPGSWLCA